MSIELYKACLQAKPATKADFDTAQVGRASRRYRDLTRRRNELDAHYLAEYSMGASGSPASMFEVSDAFNHSVMSDLDDAAWDDE